MTQTSAMALADVRWDWPDALEEPRVTKLAHFFNRVLESDDTVGFAGPIPHERALQVVADLDEAVRAGRSHVLIGEYEGRVISQCVLVPSGSPNNRHVGWIFRAMVDPAVRQHGLVRLGMRLLTERCEAIGVELLCIDVRVGTTAEQIWRHLGFQAIGVLPDYSRVNGVSSDGLYMYQRVAELKKQCRDIPS